MFDQVHGDWNDIKIVKLHLLVRHIHPSKVRGDETSEL